MSARTKSRLTRDSWLKAGQDALLRDGPRALGAEPLARRIGTTKGSFYWHFRDVPEFKQALLARWEEAEHEAMTAAASGPTPVARLRALAQHLATRGPAGDSALRAWAGQDAIAAAALARLDGARRERIAELLAETGIENPEMARILHGAALGMAGLHDGDTARNADSIGSLVDLVLALRD